MRKHMDNNPLKQYFRRPAVYMKLPSNGYGYPDGSIDIPENGELPVYPMTAIDEITARTPDALYNGIAVIELIKSCIPNIKNPWAVTNVDLDAILVAVKAASSPSGEMDVESACPACEEVSTYKANLSAMLMDIHGADFTKTLSIGEIHIQFQPINYKDINEASLQQMQLQSLFQQAENEEDEDKRNDLLQGGLKKITDLTMNLLSKSIQQISTPNTIVTEKEFILDYLQNCDKNTYFAIRDYSAALRKESELKPMKVKCIHCEHEYEQEITLNPSDFFD